MGRATEIRHELIEFIQRESDTSILKAIRTLLSKKSLDSSMKEKLTQRAMKSENDIKAGRVFTQGEAIKRTDLSLGK